MKTLLLQSKLASFEEKYVLNEIEKDSYNFMKPKFKAEIRQLKDMLNGLSEGESPDIKKLNQFGLKLIQNLQFCYESLANKQKMVGSIFP